VIALYLVPIALFAYGFRRLLLSHRPASLLMAAGLAFFAMSSAADIASLHAEEYLELIAGLCLGLGISTLMYWHLRRNLQIRVEARVTSQQGEAQAPVAPPTPRVPAGMAR
jgi:NO-binding membrane sensor protein with MHYT domain